MQRPRALVHIFKVARHEFKASILSQTKKCVPIIPHDRDENKMKTVCGFSSKSRITKDVLIC